MLEMLLCLLSGRENINENFRKHSLITLQYCKKKSLQFQNTLKVEGKRKDFLKIFIYQNPISILCCFSRPKKNFYLNRNKMKL